MKTYTTALKKLSSTGMATEHSFRGPLETLINTLDKRFTAVNEPKRQACGAPDYVVLNTSHTIPRSIGYIEAKDLWVSLDKVENTDQFSRYIGSIDNLILTNYIEFRRFIDGKCIACVTTGKCHRDKSIEIYHGKEDELKTLLQDFLSFQIEPVASARDLAVCMAKLTHAIRETVLSTLDSPYRDSLEAWREAFARTLIPDLMQDDRKADFADMYAQTIAYGFFAARCHHAPGKGEFTRNNAHDAIPKTNPLLRSLFVSLTGPDLKDEPYCRFVEDLIQLLALADMQSVLKDFGKRDRRQDPVIHFYETFLSEYNPELRKKRGIYYTPEPVVSWLVRSADAVVRKKFSIPQGLADNSLKIKQTNPATGKLTTLPKVLILDPACGTGTFLYETIKLIRERLSEQGQSGMWPAYVEENLLPRIFGFELLMAPYAVAHFKLGLQLAGYDMPDAGHNPWAYDFSGADRLRIFLTNTLEETGQAAQIALPGIMKALSDEGEAARRVKRALPVLVIMGNPPYSGHSANAGTIRAPTGKYRNKKPVSKTIRTFIGRLVEDYKQIDGTPLGEANLKWLQDDYVKFIRWAQWKLEKVDEGVVAFVTNHGYLDNPTFRGMRRSLLRSLDKIYVYDLHGNANKKEKTPDGSPDQNVFDIKQGVALLVLVKLKNGDKKALAQVYHAEMYGKREEKYNHLFETDIDATEWTRLEPTEPGYLFIPQQNDLSAEYNKGISITELFPLHSVGVVTARDKLAIHFTPEDVWETVNSFASLPPEEARAEFSLGKDARDWKVEFAQADIKQSGPDKKYIQKILYRPFDVRYTYYTGKTRGFICMPRYDVMKHMLYHDNIGIITSRLTKGESFNHVQSTLYMNEAICMSSKTSNNGYLFPLYIYKDKKQFNINKKIIDKLSFPLSDMADIYYFAYSVMNTPSYQKNFEQFLKHDFPKIPLPQNRGALLRYAELGRELIAYHTLTHAMLSDPSKWITQYPVSHKEDSANLVEAAEYMDGRVYINAIQYFSGIPENIWLYTIGGYQPAEKWLKDRRGRRLSLEEIQTYQQMILAIAETIRIKSELDTVWNYTTG